MHGKLLATIDGRRYSKYLGWQGPRVLRGRGWPANGLQGRGSIVGVWVEGFGGFKKFRQKNRWKWIFSTEFSKVSKFLEFSAFSPRILQKIKETFSYSGKSPEPWTNLNKLLQVFDRLLAKTIGNYQQLYFGRGSEAKAPSHKASKLLDICHFSSIIFFLGWRSFSCWGWNLAVKGSVHPSAVPTSRVNLWM